jgi:hypothetical protein
MAAAATLPTKFLNFAEKPPQFFAAGLAPAKVAPIEQ